MFPIRKPPSPAPLLYDCPTTYTYSQTYGSISPLWYITPILSIRYIFLSSFTANVKQIPSVPFPPVKLTSKLWGYYISFTFRSLDKSNAVLGSIMEFVSPRAVSEGEKKKSADTTPIPFALPCFHKTFLIFFINSRFAFYFGFPPAFLLAPTAGINNSLIFFSFFGSFLFLPRL